MILKRGHGGGGCLASDFLHIYLLDVCLRGLTIGDVRKGSDEEHSIWSGGSKIKDLAQCGWEEKKEKEEKNKNMIKNKNSKLLKY